MFITQDAQDFILTGALPVETRILLIIVRSLGLSENRPNYIIHLDSLLVASRR